MDFFLKLSKLLDQFLRAESWGMFFLRFTVFCVLAILFWSVINISYGKFLCDQILRFKRSQSLPILDVKYTDNRGLTMNLLLAPSTDAPAPLLKSENVDLAIFPNTLHFNIIPFLALIFASPLRTKKRLALFLVFGFMFLSLTHFLHLHLDIKAYYYSRQTFVTDSARMLPERLLEAQKFIYYTRLLSKLQGFMEQAGSMVFPVFIWMLYSQKWLFETLLARSNQRKKIAQKRDQQKPTC
ncbi:hypothetical protein K8T06_05385 [bacterium]|nr:hypothetical protein [bacterium]